MIWAPFSEAELTAGGTVNLAAEFMKRWDGSSAAVHLGRQGGPAGAGIAKVGDFNGDGITDLVFGASQSDFNDRTNSGSAYVVFGPVGQGTETLNDPADFNGVRIDGAAAGNMAGSVVNSAGDFNGDGLDDVIIGAGVNSPTPAYIVFGRTDNAVIDLASLGTQGIRILRSAPTSIVGNSVNGVGDTNGDGVDDVVVSAPANSYDGMSQAGTVFVIYGGTDALMTGQIDVTTMTDAQGRRINGGFVNSGFGTSMSSAGDVNSDGLPDLLIGAPSPFDADPLVREFVYVIYGVSGSPAPISVRDLVPSQGFRIRGPEVNQSTGYMVARGGDLTGDGIPDQIFSAPNTNRNYIVFGQEDPPFLTDLDDLGDQGVLLTGAFGPILRAGDVNGDGRPDVIIGSPFAAPNGSSSGSAFVVFGPFPPETAAIGSLGTRVARADGAAASALAGQAVGGAGNVDGIGGDDVMLSAPGNAYNGANSGSVYILDYVEPDLQIKKTAVPEEVEIGDMAEFEITVENRGRGGASDVNVRDDLPPGFILDGFETSHGSCDPTSETQLLCSLGAVPAGGSVVIGITGHFDASGVGTRTNTATIVQGGIEGKSAQAVQTVTEPPPPPPPPPPLPSSRIAVTKQANRDVVEVGDHIKYRIRIENRGEAPTNEIFVTDAFRRRVSLVSATISSGSCNEARLVRCSAPPLAPGESHLLTVEVIAKEVGYLENGALAIGNAGPEDQPPDPNDLPNFAVARVLVKPRPHQSPEVRSRLTLRITPHRITAQQGTLVRHRIVVRASRSNAKHVRVCFNLADGLRIWRVNGHRVHGRHNCLRFHRIGKLNARTIRIISRVENQFRGGTMKTGIRASAKAANANLTRDRAAIRITTPTDGPPEGRG